MVDEEWKRTAAIVRCVSTARPPRVANDGGSRKDPTQSAWLSACRTACGGFVLTLLFAHALAAAPERNPPMEVSSSAFAARTDIPRIHTCEGQDVSPPLAWSGVPSGTKSLALVIDDPDAPDPRAPKTRWVHWVLYNLPPETRGLAAGVAPSALPRGTQVGVNDWKRNAYGGPCPPVGRHRYVHTLYALDAVLTTKRPLTRADLERAMRGHVLAQSELIGYYEKQK